MNATGAAPTGTTNVWIPPDRKTPDSEMRSARNLSISLFSRKTACVVSEPQNVVSHAIDTGHFRSNCVAPLNLANYFMPRAGDGRYGL